MAFVAVDLRGREWITIATPIRDKKNGLWYRPSQIELPSGSIRKLIGRELTWEDEPVELKGEWR